VPRNRIISLDDLIEIEVKPENLQPVTEVLETNETQGMAKPPLSKKAEAKSKTDGNPKLPSSSRRSSSAASRSTRAPSEASSPAGSFELTSLPKVWETFDSPTSAVILLDWDDTLCPSTWALRKTGKTEAQLSRLAQENYMALRALTLAVEEALRLARSVARVAIVTHANAVWWRLSSHLFPGVDVKALLEQLGIEIHYAAKSPCGTQDDCEWMAVMSKKKAMMKCLQQFYSQSTSTKWNVLSVGDSHIEGKALQELARERGSLMLGKTVKLMTEPSIGDLVAQLRALGPELEAMMKLPEGFHRELTPSSLK